MIVLQLLLPWHMLEFWKISRKWKAFWQLSKGNYEKTKTMLGKYICLAGANCECWIRLTGSCKISITSGWGLDCIPLAMWSLWPTLRSSIFWELFIGLECWERGQRRQRGQIEGCGNNFFEETQTCLVILSRPSHWHQLFIKTLKATYHLILPPSLAFSYTFHHP